MITDEPRNMITLRQWAYPWLASRNVQPGDTAWPDPNDPATMDREDPRHLSLAHPAVQAYLSMIREEGRRPSTGRLDDPEELRDRMQPGRPPAPRRET